MAYEEGTKVYWKSGSKYGVTTGETKEIGGTTLVYVKFDNGIVKGLQTTQLQIVEREAKDFTSLFKMRNFSDFQQFRQFLTHRRIKGGLTNIVYSMKYGDVKFLPYQFKPVFKFIESNEQRLLIADEVGLGKTIESLYIWKELQAREDAIRLLVVCPAMLRSKWKKDMEVHFGIEARIVDAQELIDECIEARNNHNRAFALVTSLEGIRQKVVDEDKLDIQARKRKAVILNQLFEEVYEDPIFHDLFDLVIIDEAAKLANSETANFATGRRINRISHNLLLLSATPVSNSQSDLYSLLKLLSPSEFRNEYVFNELYEQNRFVVGLSHCFYNPSHNIQETVETANNIIERIKLTKAFGQDPFFLKLQNNLESIIKSDDLRRKTYSQLTDRFFYSSVFSRSRKRDVIEDVAVRSAQTAGFELSDYELEIYNSCTKDLEELSLEEHDRIFSFGIMARQRELASSIPAALKRWKDVYLAQERVNEEDEFTDDEEDKKSSIPETALRLTYEEIQELERQDRKYRKFVQTLREKINTALQEGRNEKIVVFSFFRETLRYLARRLAEDRISSLVIMGGMDQNEKDANLAKFRDDPSINVFLSSEVGAEGLDMQFSSIEFNYDLPWNPMRLEQRIGRIDRIGQEAKRIRIVNMFCTNTIEDRILEKLYTKINIFKESIGELDEILGQQTQEIEKTLLTPGLSKENKEQLADAEINRFFTNLQSIRKLEESAGLSKAFSDTIVDYVNSAEQNSRYIRKEDIINYLYDFFTRDGQGSHFSRNTKYKECWDLELSSKDKQSLKNYLDTSGKYYPGANKDKITCTFPQGKKSVNYGFANIDVNHPILKWIYDCTEKKMENTYVPNSFTLSVPSSSINRSVFDKNTYVFYMCFFECSGLKKKKELMYFLCSPEDLLMKSPLECENFVAQSLFNGNAVINLKSKLQNTNTANVDKALELCKEEFIKLASSTKEELEDNNEAVYHRMMAKTNSYFEDKIDGIKQNISEREIELRTEAFIVTTTIQEETGLDLDTETLIEKAGAIRRFLSLKEEKDIQQFDELNELIKSHIQMISTETREDIAKLQKAESTIKGFYTRLETAQKQYKEALTDIEIKKEMIINFEEVGGGLIFVD